MTRIGIISDIHGNLPALEAVLSALNAEGAETVIFCGDLVGYGPWPGEVIARMQGSSIGVQGNHDAAACGALPTNHFTPAARAAIDWIRSRLSAADIAYLSSLPLTREVEGMTVVHGSPRGPLWEYILDPWTAAESLSLLSTDINLFGHSHIQGGFVADGEKVEPIDPRAGTIELVPGLRYLINPGSVGQPRDGDPRAAYAILDLKQGTIAYHRISYDISAVQREIIRVGLPRELADRLSVGR
ncbi:metallophosphoesterase [Candidatus Acetothermia bacterium]|nr:metallophosphoesterase family protein [Candidatus Bipolaricaulota bacterium]RLE40146.1 MAG: metallophosphoesterase [Candidatus Acetothermia bacterium]